MAQIALVGIARLVRGGAALNNEINKVLKSYGNVQTRLHEMAVSAMLHAAEDGQPAPLTKLFDGLSKSDQNALKVWVSELAGIAIAPNGLGPDAGWLDMKGGKFLVIKGTTEQRKAFADEANITKVLDGRKFMDKKPKADGEDDAVKVFGPEDAYARFQSVFKAIHKVGAETFTAEQLALVNKFAVEFTALIPAEFDKAA